MNRSILATCFSISLLLTACSTLSNGQDSSKLTGRIERKNGQPVPNAEVVVIEEPNRNLSVIPMAPKQVLRAKTNSEGEFEFKLPPGTDKKRLILSVVGERKEKQIAPDKVQVTSSDVSFQKPLGQNAD